MAEPTRVALFEEALADAERWQRSGTAWATKTNAWLRVIALGLSALMPECSCSPTMKHHALNCPVFPGALMNEKADAPVA